MAFVPRCLPTRLDYCNSVLWASPIKLLQRLQSVQHAVSSARRREHISLILRELHRLHICARHVKYKDSSVDVHKLLNSLTPSYVVDDYHLVAYVGRCR